MPSSLPPLAHAEDAPSDTPPADSASTPVDEQRHPSFPPGRVEDFDFSYSPHRESARSSYPPPRGASVHFHPHGGQERVPPPGVDTGGNTVSGGKITTPRFIDRSRMACAKNTSKFDAAGLAEAKYHIGEYGVEVLTLPIISNCGYQSFHQDHPEDILLCYSEISNIHRVVLQGWVNSRTHFCGSVVEYILEKAITVFPRLSSLEVADVVKIYDSVQKIPMRYLLPLMPFDSICLTFGFEGLCPPGLGTIRYTTIAFAWIDVLPRILPQEDSEIELIKFAVGYESNNVFDLMWHVLELAVPGFKSTNPVQVQTWTANLDIFLSC